MSVVGRPPVLKARARTTTAANSATLAMATHAAPGPVRARPASLRIGITSPSPVAERATATSTGASSSPTTCSRLAATSATTSPATYAPTARSSTRPRMLRRSTSMPARKNRKVTPSSARVSTAVSTVSQPSTCGPTTTPARSSTTITGTAETTRTDLARIGAATASSATMATLVSDIGRPYDSVWRLASEIG